MKMLLITNEAGGIVGAAHLPGKSSRKENVALEPLPGQRVHQVDVPDSIARLSSGHHFHLALSHATFDAASGKLTFKRIKTVKHHGRAVGRGGG